MIQLGDKLLPWLEKALDLSYQRQSVLSGNLANVDTPGYTPRDIEFKEFLVSELEAGPEAEGTAPMATARPGAEPGLDGNRVDLDTEMARMTSNRVFYELATEMTSRRLGLLRYAIDEGGR